MSSFQSNDHATKQLKQPRSKDMFRDRINNFPCHFVRGKENVYRDLLHFVKYAENYPDEERTLSDAYSLAHSELDDRRDGFEGLIDEFIDRFYEAYLHMRKYADREPDLFI